METGKKGPKWNADVKTMSFVSGLCWVFFLFFFLSFFNSLVGRLRVYQLLIWWLAWYCWLGGVCLDVVVSGDEV
jgi:hypothetical protein